MNINYLKFLLKAKGRHGTHSPFVYHYAESVMHGNRQFYLDDEIESLSLNTWDKRRKKFFFQTIDFLQITDLFIEKSCLSAFVDLEKVIHLADGRINIHQKIESLPSGNQSCIITLSNKLMDIPNPFEGIVLILNPHQNELNWHKWKQHTNAKLTVDCWHWGMILFNPAFKQMHHYLIK